MIRWIASALFASAAFAASLVANASTGDGCELWEDSFPLCMRAGGTKAECERQVLRSRQIRGADLCTGRTPADDELANELAQCDAGDHQLRSACKGKWNGDMALCLHNGYTRAQCVTELTELECEARAELHYEVALVAGENPDAAYEDAYAACLAAEDTYVAARQTAHDMAARCETTWVERVPGGWMAVCGDAYGEAIYEASEP